MTEGYYRPEDISKMGERMVELREQNQEQKERIVRFPFATAKGTEHAQHGYLRRVDILWRCVQKVFEFIPPELEGRPERDAVKDATVYLHAFHMNAFGACDNLAWVLVNEKNIRRADGEELPSSWVSVRPGSSRVRNAVSSDMVAVLEKFDDWFSHMDEFRHSLAHRIPLYVPPYTVSKENMPDYERLECESWEALTSGNIAAHEALKSEQVELTRFSPWFTHSFSESSPQMVIHPQLLADFGAVLELGDATMNELG